MKRASFIQIVWTFIFLFSMRVVAAASITDDLPLSQTTLAGREDAFQRMSSVLNGETIVAFDASEEMGILLITTDHNPLKSEYHLRCMDSDGNLTSVYSFTSQGSVGVAWDGEDICVFFDRSDIIMKISCEGTLKACLSLSENNYETFKVWQALGHRWEKEVTTGTYKLRSTGLSIFHGMNKFTELVFIDSETGREKILYNAGKTASSKTIVICLGVLLLALLFLKSFKKQKRQMEINATSTQAR